MNSKRRVVACIALLCALVTAVALTRARAQEEKAPQRPNIVFHTDAQHQIPTTYYDSDAMAAIIEKGGNLSPRLGVSGATEFWIHVAHGDTGGAPEMHAHTTHIIYVIEGDYNYVTGGTITDAKEVAPGEIVGTKMVGGVSHHLKPGQILIIPQGTPHERIENKGHWVAYLVNLASPY